MGERTPEVWIFFLKWFLMVFHGLDSVFSWLFMVLDNSFHGVWICLDLDQL